ncbi:invasion gene expression up-regulator, SirB [Alcanivorax xiamenensis]|uniref:Invasion gene expression up-regulator, SirB n=2 Tax=Alcanivoracaceae TaxID=224372 RepID=A0ABQ6YA53_9GAMM|nr:invasion gene expression up-regulator, SirB [Alcanivorax xiamenensis]
MMLDYLLIKHLHMTLAALSLGLFVLRAGWSVTESPMLRRRWVRVTPHLVDTLLLILGVTLMVLLRAWPHQTPWLAAKLLALVAYIGLGTMAIKRGTTPARRAGYALAAVLIFLYMVGVAVRHHPGSWLS